MALLSTVPVQMQRARSFVLPGPMARPALLDAADPRHDGAWRVRIRDQQWKVVQTTQAYGPPSGFSPPRPGLYCRLVRLLRLLETTVEGLEGWGFSVTGARPWPSALDGPEGVRVCEQEEEDRPTRNREPRNRRRACWTWGLTASVANAGQPIEGRRWWTRQPDGATRSAGQCSLAALPRTSVAADSGEASGDSSGDLSGPAQRPAPPALRPSPHVQAVGAPWPPRRCHWAPLRLQMQVTEEGEMLHTAASPFVQLARMRTAPRLGCSVGHAKGRRKARSCSTRSLPGGGSGANAGQGRHAVHFSWPARAARSSQRAGERAERDLKSGTASQHGGDETSGAAALAAVPDATPCRACSATHPLSTLSPACPGEGPPCWPRSLWPARAPRPDVLMRSEGVACHRPAVRR